MKCYVWIQLHFKKALFQFERADNFEHSLQFQLRFEQKDIYRQFLLQGSKQLSIYHLHLSGLIPIVIAREELQSMIYTLTKKESPPLINFIFFLKIGG